MLFKFPIIFAIYIFSASGSLAQAGSDLNNGIDRPKLVVGLVVDQMRWDYLYRYFNRYGNGGFKRLLNKGFSCDNTFIPYTPTVTAAGHTCLYTGSVPAIHGVVGNDWVEQSTGKYMYCTADSAVSGIGSNSPAGKMSPRNMLSNTIGDELRLATNFKSRVFGIALKDRGGILPAGHSANAAYWFDDFTGKWITSSYYMNQLPAWVDAFNRLDKTTAYLNQPWALSRDEKLYDQSIPDDSAYQRSSALEISKGFPHRYTTNGGKDFNAVRSTPFGNSLTLNFAEALLTNEKIGMSGQTDMLCISLSSTDYITHRFGPQARETEDTYLRLDKDLEAFFNMLDAKIGAGKWTMFLSADHGVLQSPAYLNDIKMPGGVLTLATTMRELNTQLLAKYNVKNLLSNYFEYQLYFDKRKIDSAKIDLAQAEDFVTELLMKRPEVAYAFSYRKFQSQTLQPLVKMKLENGYYPKRSGDIQMILKPNYSDFQAKGSDHGSWYAYDTHIPLLWYGWGIRQGATHRETYMTDVATTLAALLHIQMPNGSIGKVIEEVLK